MKELICEMIGYKIFNGDLTCRGFKFEIGKINELGNDEPLELCKNGFHFCKYPSGVWSYYTEGRVFKIKAYEVLDQPETPGADLKLICRKIELLEEIKPDGNYNTGRYNTGNGNTGHCNTGSHNTGHCNTGSHNTGNGWSGNLNVGEAPFYMFNKMADKSRVDFGLVHKLYELLVKSESIDPTPFLTLPNATKKKIKALHEATLKAMHEATLKAMDIK